MPPPLLLESAARDGGRPASFWRFPDAPGRGTGRTAVLAVAGLGLDGRVFSRLAPLATERDLVLVNLPNDLPAETRMEDLAREAWSAFDAAGHSGRPALLLGSSFGGMAALAAAFAEPSRTRGLVLIGAPARWGDVPLRLRAVSRTHALVPRRAYPRVFTAVMLPPFKGYPPDVEADLRAQFLHRTKEHLGACVGAMRAFDARDRLPEVRVPTLILHGERDPVIPIRAGRAVAAAIPGARFVPVPRCGHLPHVTQPGPVLDAIRRFLAESSL